MVMNVADLLGVGRCCAICILQTLLLFVTSTAFATNAFPTLPPVEFPDTEVVTNVAITTSNNASRDYAFELAFIGSASNNVEIAYDDCR